VTCERSVVSPGTPDTGVPGENNQPFTNKTKCHNITEILLKVLHHNTNPNSVLEKL
jgi:hypothetical protein